MEANALETVYSQGVMFLSLFGTMFIISYFITDKFAKKFENEHSLEDRIAAAKKERLVSNFLNSSIVKIAGKDAKLEELNQDLRKGAINQEEFMLLKQTLQTY